MTDINAFIESGGISGSLSGALDPDSKEADEHARRYYGLVRNMKTDVANIAKNTGFTVEQIERVKEHLFIKKHDLGGEEHEHFYPLYEIARSWQRLIDGSDIKEQDIVLLNHELLEREYMAGGLPQGTAHEKAEETYNYAKFIKREV